MIPNQLRSYFHDSALKLHSYDAEARQLCIQIEKEIGPEVGIITLRGVSFISIAEYFPGDAIKATPIVELPENYWYRYSGYPDLFESDDIAYEFNDQEGPVHVVVAKTIYYKVIDVE